MAPLLVRKNSIEELDIEDWILGLLEYAGGKIENESRIHSGLFLVKENTGLIRTEFEPSENGPYSTSIQETIESLIKKGLITRQMEMKNGYPVVVIKLTDKGIQKAKRALEVIQESSYWKLIEGFFSLATKGKLLALMGMISILYPEMYKN